MVNVGRLKCPLGHEASQTLIPDGVESWTTDFSIWGTPDLQIWIGENCSLSQREISNLFKWKHADFKGQERWGWGTQCPHAAVTRNDDSAPLPTMVTDHICCHTVLKGVISKVMRTPMSFRMVTWDQRILTCSLYDKCMFWCPLMQSGFCGLVWCYLCRISCCRIKHHASFYKPEAKKSNLYSEHMSILIVMNH